MLLLVLAVDMTGKDLCLICLLAQLHQGESDQVTKTETMQCNSRSSSRVAEQAIDKARINALKRLHLQGNGALSLHNPACRQ